MSDTKPDKSPKLLDLGAYTTGISVTEPHRPQGSDALKIRDYFYTALTSNLTLFPQSEVPLVLPPIDFYFGGDTLLERILLSNDMKLVPENALVQELVSPVNRLLTWDDVKGQEIAKTYYDLLRSAKKIAYVCCHGDTYGEEGDKFWALATLDVAYGADRVVGALIKEDYDLIVMTACNPDGLPLAVETANVNRPTIFRFNVTNDFNIPKNIDPIKIIHAVSL